MRYFLNTSAGRPITAGGQSFTFELMGLRGGSWLGILAVADDAAASVLATAPNTEEISEETFESVKKKQSHGAGPLFSNSPRAPQSPPAPSLAVADHAGRPTAQPIVNPSNTLTPVTLFTTKQAPAVEQLLAPGNRMSRPK
jgi:hypothetical protein